MIYSFLLSMAICVLSSVAFAAGNLGQLKVEIIQTNSAHRTPVKLRMNGVEIGSFSHSTKNVTMNISSNHLKNGQQTPLQSNYGSLQEGCSFQYVLSFSFDGGQWIRLGQYNAPTEQVNTTIPLGLCDGKLCSGDGSIAAQLKRMEEIRWQKNKEELRKWLEDVFEKERIAFEESKRRALEVADAKETTVDVNIEVPEAEPGSNNSGNGVEENPVATATDVESVVNEVMLEEDRIEAQRTMDLLKSCQSMSSYGQYICSQYGGLGWLGAAAEGLAYGQMAEKGLLTQEQINQKILSKEALGRYKISGQIEKQAILLSEIERKKQSAVYARHLKTIREIAVNGGRFAPLVGDGIDIYETIYGIDASNGSQLDGTQRFFAALGMIGGNRALWEELSAEIKMALMAGKGNDARSLAAIADKIASMSNIFDSKGVGHVLFGETKLVDGVTKIKSGLHSESAVQALIKEWEAQGLKSRVIDVKSYSDFSKELRSGEDILRYQAPNGVIAYQFPQDRFINERIAYNNVASLDGKVARGAKTVFPAGWDEQKILNSIEESYNKGVPNARGRAHSVGGVSIQVGVGPDSDRIITGFPKLGE